MIDCAAIGDCASQIAIATRLRLSAAVAAAIAEVGAREAVVALIGNDGADTPDFSLARYIERLGMDSSLGTIRGIFVAQTIKPQARVLAESRGFRWVEVDYDVLRGRKSEELTLF